MLSRFFQWFYMRRARRGPASAAGEYRPARLPYERVFAMPRFGKYETFPRLKRFLTWLVFLLAAIFLIWFAAASLSGIALFE